MSVVARDAFAAIACAVGDSRRCDIAGNRGQVAVNLVFQRWGDQKEEWESGNRNIENIVVLQEGRLDELTVAKNEPAPSLELKEASRGQWLDAAWGFFKRHGIAVGSVNRTWNDFWLQGSHSSSLEAYRMAKDADNYATSHLADDFVTDRYGPDDKPELEDPVNSKWR
eukprot:TRINITY_DN86905_c0_g1_i1.p1 TRINITY_DN86905_c0_g1~~TRINITY_DN86905_c0_g1_i1.p1  ORF type:complete len:178 (-),score=21.52 TRINITY_DN86905_c0_g1_i1:49-552(-)